MKITPKADKNLFQRLLHAMATGEKPSGRKQENEEPPTSRKSKKTPPSTRSRNKESKE